MTGVTWGLPAGAGRRRLDVLAMGSFLAEQVIHVERHPAAGDQGSIPIRSLASSTGGGAANVAAYAARLGGRSAVLATTGDGPRSLAALEGLADAGVETGAVAVRPGHDADLLVLLSDPAGDWVAMEQLDPALRLAAADLGPAVPFAEATWFHVDGYAHHSAGSQAVADEAVRLARVAGCAVSVDAAVPSSLADPAYLRSLFARADIVFANRAEAASLTGQTQDDGAVDALLALGPAVVILKCGADGSVVATRGGRARVAAIPVDVVDTLAAGDAYVAAVLVGLARGEELLEAARRGAAAGALACRTPGSQGGSFSTSDLDALLANGPGPVGATVPHARGPRPRLFAGFDGPLPAYVLVPGSEHRVRRFGEHLDEVRTLAQERDFLLVAGTLDGIPVAACSTGIGGYGVSLAVDALGGRGATTFIRVGVTGALQERIGTGDLVIASGAVRMDGTSDVFADPAYPAAADTWVTAALVAAAHAAGAPVHVGVGGTSSSFYAGEGIPAFGGFVSASMAGIEDELRAAGVLDWDTETATLFTVARLRGWRAGRMNVVVDDRSTGRYNPIGEPRAIEVALRAVRILAGWDTDGLTRWQPARGGRA
jgi:uridine phosphorylase